jgi:hypothetical protein
VDNSLSIKAGDFPNGEFFTIGGEQVGILLSLARTGRERLTHFEQFFTKWVEQEILFRKLEELSLHPSEEETGGIISPTWRCGKNHAGEM